MTAAERAELRQAIDAAKRARLFTTNSRGHQVLRTSMVESTESKVVVGINHGTHWSYQKYECRCGICVEAERARLRSRRQRKREQREAA